MTDTHLPLRCHGRAQRSMLLSLCAADALLKLCANSGFTCWVSGPSVPGLCPLITGYGNIEKQDCYQQLRFVCRTKGGSPAPGRHKKHMHTRTCARGTEGVALASYAYSEPSGWTVSLIMDQHKGTGTKATPDHVRRT